MSFHCFNRQKGLLVYHAEAMEMMHEAMGGVRRFLGNDDIPANRKETVKAHTENVGQHGYALIEQTERQMDRKLGSYSLAFTHRYRPHDWGEIVIEPLIAYGEMDPDVKEALAAFPAAQIEGQIASHFYRYALTMSYEGRPQEFEQYVDHARKTCVPASHATGQMQKQTRDILRFYQNVSFLMTNSDAAMSQLSEHWSAAHTNRHVAIMEAHYNDIERQQSFIGTWAKVLEKMDGTAYGCDVRQETGRLGQDGRFENRIMGRYEGCFHNLLTQAGEEPVHQRLATNLILEAYRISLQNVGQHSGILLLDGMEQTVTCREAEGIYGQRLEELRSNKNLILTPDQFRPGQTLLQMHLAA